MPMFDVPSKEPARIGTDLPDQWNAEPGLSDLERVTLPWRLLSLLLMTSFCEGYHDISTFRQRETRQRKGKLAYLAR